MKPAPATKPVRFRQRSEMLDFLLEAATLTSQTLDLDALLASIAEIVKKVLDYQLFAILLYSERRQSLRIRYAVGHRDEVVRNLSLSLDEGITGAAAKERRAVLVENVFDDPRYLNGLDAVRSELAVPMMARGKLVGVIDLQSTRPGAYTQSDSTMLRLIASRVGAAIDNARLYRRVERQNRTLRTLAHLSQGFSSLMDLDELLRKISVAVRQLIEYDAFSILLVDREAGVLRHRVSLRYDKRVEVDNIPLGKGITGAAAESGQPIRVCDTQQDPRYIASHPDIRSEIAVPLVVQDRVVGVMDLESEHVNRFSEDHQRTLSLLAPQIAISVENARLYGEVALRERRLEDDLKSARELQYLMLPAEAPAVARMDIAMRLRPAREVSGDIYDFFEHGDSSVAVAFGDVSGKGVAAALFGALVSGLMRTLAPRRKGPAALMKALNDALIERKVEARYVTLLVMLWNPQTRQIVMSNAGVMPPLVLRAGAVHKVRAEGVPLGLLDACEYDETVFDAQPGDTIVLYSDGVTDHLSPEGEEYGRARLRSVIEASGAESAAGIVEAIFEDLDRFNTEMFDDQTVLAMKVL
jgi:sigma-B regulation protein RsbU (phosphoserine phosphatase)